MYLHYVVCVPGKSLKSGRDHNDFLMSNHSTTLRFCSSDLLVYVIIFCQLESRKGLRARLVHGHVHFLLIAILTSLINFVNYVHNCTVDTCIVAMNLIRTIVC